MVSERYKTGWLRVKASFVDANLLTIFSYIALLVLYNVNSIGLRYFLCALIVLVPLLYEVLCHALWGQTFGKYVYGLKVMDVSETAKISVKNAIIRDIVPILIYAGLYIFSIKDNGLGAEMHNIVWMIGVLGLWAILELVTMLFNDKRRAFHDLIAHSVVVREVDAKTWSLFVFWGFLIAAGIMRALIKI